MKKIVTVFMIGTAMMLAASLGSRSIPVLTDAAILATEISTDICGCIRTIRSEAPALYRTVKFE